MDQHRQQKINTIRSETENQLTSKGASLHEMEEMHQRVTKVGDDASHRRRGGQDHLL